MPRHKSNKRFEVLAALRQNPRASYRELMAATGLRSISSVAYHLKQLEEDGLIQMGEKHLARSLTLTNRKLIVQPRKRILSDESRSKMSAGANKARVRILDALGKVTPDLDLEARIEAIGKREDERLQSSHSTDVVNFYHKFRFRSSGLKCTRMG